MTAGERRASRHIRSHPKALGQFGTMLVMAGLILLLTPIFAIAQETVAPMAVQIPMLAKVLGFERNLKVRAGNTLVVGVAFQRRNRASTTTRDAFVAALDTPRFRPLGNVPVRVVSIDLDGRGDIATALKTAGVRVLYVTPLRAFSIKTLAAAARSRGITTVTGVSEYVEQGVAIGIVIRDERTTVLVNLAAAKAEGADFAAPLLQLARMVP